MYLSLKLDPSKPRDLVLSYLVHCWIAIYFSPIAWGYRIYRFISAVGWDSPEQYPGYDIEQYDGEAQVILELWRMHCTSLLPSLLGSLWPGVVVFDSPIGQIKLFDFFYYLGFLEYCLHLYGYFNNVSADMSTGLLQVFVELWNLHGTSNYV